MQARKAQLNQSPVAAICIQETHIGSDDEKGRLQAMWAQIKGLMADQGDRYFCWSTESSRTGGVAILINPHLSVQVVSTLANPKLDEPTNKHLD